MSYLEIGKSVPYPEAIMLASVLARDPGSWLGAAMNNWKYPVSREWLVAAHTYDLLAGINSKKGSKPKPYPTPFADKSVKRVGGTTRSNDEVRRILNWMNPKE